MNTNTITYIKNPPFTVDFNQFLPDATPHQPLTLNQRIVKTAARSFTLIGYFAQALCRSGFETVKYSWTSFKITVLGYYGSLSNFRISAELSLVLLKIALWIAQNAWVFTKTTARVFLEKAYPHAAETITKAHADKEINTAHIRSNEIVLDASGVPPETTVSSLLTIFDACNFTNRDALDYLGHMDLSEPGTIYTPTQIRTHLQTFIRRVNNREAFLGTPPSYDTARLLAFYQQIEDAVRIALHEYNNRMNEFTEKHGANFDVLNDDQKTEYKNLLEDKARIVIDLAIAGNHCGARFMGESMKAYYAAKGESGSEEKNLAETLIDILSRKRIQLAESQILAHLGADTHSYANYMGTIGVHLGIPGSQNVTEELASTLDSELYLQRFFREYTVNTIIDTIQEKIKSSNSLREKIRDWFLDQRNTWLPWPAEEYEQRKTAISDNIRAIIDGNIAGPSSSSAPAIVEAPRIVDLLTHLKDSGVEFPSTENAWEDFVLDLLATDVVKTWCQEHLPDVKPTAAQEKMQNKTRLAQILNRQKIQNFQNECLKLSGDQKQNIEAFLEGTAELNLHLFSSATPEDVITPKINAIRSLLKQNGLFISNEQTLLNIVTGQLSVEEAVTTALEDYTKDKFSEGLRFDNLHKDGLSPEVMEWLLVSQGILNPQTRSAPINPAALNFTATRQQNTDYVSNVSQLFTQTNATNILALNGWLQRLPNDQVPNEDLENQAEGLLPEVPGSNKRYQFVGTGDAKTQLLTKIFDRVFEHNPQQVIQITQNNFAGITEPLYPRWKNVCKITIPRTIGNVLSHTLVKVMIITATAIGTIMLGNRARTIALNQFVAKFIPYFINNTPVKAIQIGNKVIDQVVKVHTYVKTNYFKLLFAAWAGRAVILRLPEIPYLTRFARAFDVWSILRVLSNSPGTFFGFMWDNTWNTVKFAWNSCNAVSRFFVSTAATAETEKNNICRQKALSIWLRTCEQLRQPEQIAA